MRVRLLINCCVLVSLLSGCAVSSFKVNLNKDHVGVTEFSKKVVVKDGRMDNQLYMTGISFGGQVNMYPLTPDPTLSWVLQKNISDQLFKKENLFFRHVIEVVIEEVDIKNKVGFGVADELSCKIVSKVRIQDEKSLGSPRSVQTFTKSSDNMSPFVSTAAESIIRKCLDQHALEIVVISL